MARRPASAKAARPPACPVCRSPSLERFRPFCSQRCADVDLGRWLTGAYAIPVTEDDEAAGEAPSGRPVAGPP